MKVAELVEILQRHDQDAEVIIAESQYDNNVLIVMEDPSNPDDAEKNPEIRFS